MTIPRLKGLLSREVACRFWVGQGHLWGCFSSWDNTVLGSGGVVAALRSCGLQSGRRDVKAAAAPERDRGTDSCSPEAETACQHFGAQAFGLALLCASPVSCG